MKTKLRLKLITGEIFFGTMLLPCDNAQMMLYDVEEREIIKEFDTNQFEGITIVTLDEVTIDKNGRTVVKDDDGNIIGAQG